MTGYIVTCNGRPQRRVKRRVYNGQVCRPRIALAPADPATVFPTIHRARRAVENSRLAGKVEIIPELQDELNNDAWRIWKVETQDR